MTWNVVRQNQVDAMVAYVTGDPAAPSVALRLLLNAALAEEDDKDVSLAASEAQPGYLRGKVGEQHLYVPYNLVRGLAPRTLLEQIVGVGNAIRICDQSRLCVSGSSTFLGDLNFVADIDFCEYASIEPLAIATRVVTLAERDHAPHLIEVKIDGQKQHHPWRNCSTRTTALLTQNLSHPPANPAMFDFIDGSTTLGLIPVTNLVLPVLGDRPHEGHGAASHPFQEVIVTPVEVVIPDLTDKSVLVAYTNFLRGEVIARQQSDPIKALKRAISLFRLLGIEDMTETAIDMVNDPASEAIVRRKRRDELIKWSDRCDPTVKEWLSSQLTQAPKDDELEQGLITAVSVHATLMSTYVETLLSLHQSRLAAS